MFATTMNAAPMRTVAEIIGRSVRCTASQPGQADALDAEDLLGEDRAGQQVGEVEAEDGHHRDDGGAQRVPVGDASFGQALGPRGADVVLVERRRSSRRG